MEARAIASRKLVAMGFRTLLASSRISLNDGRDQAGELNCIPIR